MERPDHKNFGGYITYYVIDEDHLDTLWKGFKRHHLSDGHDGCQFLARKFEISRLQSCLRMQLTL